MSEKLDMDKDVVTDKKPTAYLEDVISQIVDDLGGETARSVSDQVRLSEALTWINLARIKSNR